MTWKEAKIYAQKQIKVTHNYFSSSEWLIMKGNIIEFEDGVQIFEQEFFNSKEFLKDNWSLFKEN